MPVPSPPHLNLVAPGDPVPRLLPAPNTVLFLVIFSTAVSLVKQQEEEYLMNKFFSQCRLRPPKVNNWRRIL